MATSLWKQKNFMLMWGGQVVSWLGTEVSGIALPLVVLALTGSPARAGFVAAIRGAVYVVWAIPAGVAVDGIWNKLVMVLKTYKERTCDEFYSFRVSFTSPYHTGTVHRVVLPLKGRVSCLLTWSFYPMPQVVSKEQFAAASSMPGDELAILIGPP